MEILEGMAKRGKVEGARWREVVRNTKNCKINGKLNDYDGEVL